MKNPIAINNNGRIKDQRLMLKSESIIEKTPMMTRMEPINMVVLFFI
jgi:hypothetical protein